MRKVSLWNLTLTGHSEGKKGKWQLCVTYLTNLNVRRGSKRVRWILKGKRY